MKITEPPRWSGNNPYIYNFAENRDGNYGSFFVHFVAVAGEGDGNSELATKTVEVSIESPVAGSGSYMIYPRKNLTICPGDKLTLTSYLFERWFNKTEST